ncbi:MAG: DUF4399 domain-containing protein [Flavobacteriales bacterium]|nr:DUF4399 domain-containing protein [Flavobacteriales bacterium]
MKKLFFPLIAVALLTSCGGSTETKSENTEVESMVDDHEGHDHEGHDHGDEMTGDPVPAVPEGSRIFFANLEEGATITSPVYVEFGAEGIEVEPAGVVKEGYGHHHILINEDIIPVGGIVPANETNIHYGGGQTGDTLDLPIGTHTLVLQFADGLHRSYGELLAAKISVTVE